MDTDFHYYPAQKSKPICYMRLKIKNYCLKIFIKMRVDEKVYKNI